MLFWANAKIGYIWSVWANIRYILKPSKTCAPRTVFCPWKSGKQNAPKTVSVPHGLQNWIVMLFLGTGATWTCRESLLIEASFVSPRLKRQEYIYSFWRTPPALKLLHRPRGTGIILANQTRDHLDAGWCRQIPWCCIDGYDHIKHNRVHITSTITT